MSFLHHAHKMKTQCLQCVFVKQMGWLKSKLISPLTSGHCFFNFLHALCHNMSFFLLLGCLSTLCICSLCLCASFCHHNISVCMHRACSELIVWYLNALANWMVPLSISLPLKWFQDDRCSTGIMLSFQRGILLYTSVVRRKKKAMLQWLWWIQRRRIDKPHHV